MVWEDAAAESEMLLKTGVYGIGFCLVIDWGLTAHVGCGSLRECGKEPKGGRAVRKLLTTLEA
jgi:hypothetical protein